MGAGVVVVPEGVVEPGGGASVGGCAVAAIGAANGSASKISAQTQARFDRMVSLLVPTRERKLPTLEEAAVQDLLKSADGSARLSVSTCAEGDPALDHAYGL